MNQKKIIFMGTPTFAGPVLSGLINNYQVILVVTQPDKEVGRKKEVIISPIKELALKNNIPLFQPEKIKEDYQLIIDLKPDLIVTCAYGQIIPKAILDCPKDGCVNVHASLLPALRGGAPIHKALIEGHQKTGITIMWMDEGMDSGDIIAQAEYIIKATDNVGILHDILSEMGSKLLLEVLPDIFSGNAPRIKQDQTKVTYAYNIKRAEEHLDFNQSSEAIANQIRGLNPWPLANFILNNQEFKVLDCYYTLTKHETPPGVVVEVKRDAIGISSKDGIVYLTRIKPFGKKIMTTQDYLNGVLPVKILSKEVS